TIFSKKGVNTYDILLPERNVLFESIYVPFNAKLKEKDIVVYKKNNNISEAIVTKIDWNSESAQIQIIKRNYILLAFDDETLCILVKD
ncbi:unnamed protein product, partial [marine sediment metagenome]